MSYHVSPNDGKNDWWDEACKAYGEKNFWKKKKRKSSSPPKKGK